MRILNDTICKVCQGVFCCAACLRNHEIKNHAIVVRKPVMMPTENQNEGTESCNKAKTAFETTYLFCSICEKRALILQPELDSEMLLHIELHHLPLRCQKCFKIYKKISDLKELSKCVPPTIVCPDQESLGSNQFCCTNEASKLTVTKAAIPYCVTSHNSPSIRRDCNEGHITPISIINMRWKAKSKLSQEEFISDSVSSIKNISSISNSSIRRNTETSSEVKGKIIRCSSTPVHLEMVFARPKEQTFNATGSGHMSSIQYNSCCESDSSPAVPQPNSSQALEPVNRYMKITGSRARISAVTPLRQVMSKSIQKAFAEHGVPESTEVKGSNAFQPENIFDSTSPPALNEESPHQPPLDLRLSPAVRRSQNEGGEFLKNTFFYNQQKDYNELPNLRRKILLSAQKLTTESIVITRTERLSSVSSSTSVASSNYSMNSVKPSPRSTSSSYQSAESCGSVFKSCSSVEIITATTEEIQQLQSFNEEKEKNIVVSPLTPITRVPGAVINKKFIKFETPKLKPFESCDYHNSPNDEFFTPNATPLPNSESDSAETKHRKLLVKQNLNGRFSPERRPSIRECAHSTAVSQIENVTTDFDDFHNVDYENEVFLPEEPKNSPQKLNDVKQDNKTQQPKSLWSFMTSVMRLPLHKGSNSNNLYKNEKYSTSNSIIKRCASIAGSLVRSKSLESQSNSLKRKRTYTIDNQTTATYLTELHDSEATSHSSDFNTSSKRFRIQARRPIDRMRLNS